jgi:acylglycerol lipase
MDCMSSSSSSSSSSPLMLTSGASGRVNALCSLRVWRSLMMLINAFVLLLLVPFRRAPSSRKEEKREESGGAHRHQRKVVRVPAGMVASRKSRTVEQEVAARRALATRRVMQDGNGDGDGDGDGDEKNKKSVREYSLFVTARGDTIFTQSWTPVSVNTR